MVSRDSVAVVVVVRRLPERLDGLLESLRGQVLPGAITVAALGGVQVTVPPDVRVVELPGSASLSTAVSAALEGHSSDAVWVLRDDTKVRVGALAALLAVFDTSPSVGVVGPKQLDSDLPGEIREMGESISRSGFAVQLAERELDQGQYDRQSDVLGVGEAGMLVRRVVWDELDGFDDALGLVDGALDFCYRARTAGWRVEIVPAAVVETGESSLEAVLGEVSPARVIREEAQARAHRVLAYLTTVVAPLRAVSLLLGALTRGFGRFVGKQPHPFAELRGTVRGVLRQGAIGRSRRAIARVAKQPIDRARLFVSRSEMTRRRALERDAIRAAREALDDEPRLGFGQLGAWMTAAATVVGLILGYSYLGAAALSGGGLLPLSTSIADTWSAVGATWTPLSGGLESVPDGFAALVAALATVTWWDPNLSVVALWALAVPLSFVAGWVGSGVVTVKSGTAFIVGTLWALMPSLHIALAEGRLGSVLAHIAIPFAARSLLSRGTVSGGWFGLLAAVVWVSVPALAPVIVVATIVRAVSGRPLIVLGLAPALALEWPRLLAALSANPLSYFADRGVPVAPTNPPFDLLAVWPAAPSIPFVDDTVALIVVYAIVAVSVAATVFVVIRGNPRLGLIASVGAIGVVTAAALATAPLAHITDQPVGLSSAALLDPLWFALSAGLAIAATSIPFVRGVAMPVVVAAVALASATTIAAPFIGTTLVAASPVRSVPAYVEAETRTHPAAGTLVITPRDSAIVAELQRGSGSTLVHWTATAATRTGVNPTERSVATLAGNLIVESGFDVIPAANDLNIRFVLLKASPTNPAVSAIASHPGLTQVGQTANGVLWIVDIEPRATLDHPGRDVAYLAIAGLVIAVAIIAAIPTTLPRRRRVVDDAAEEGESDGR